MCLKQIKKPTIAIQSHKAFKNDRLTEKQRVIQKRVPKTLRSDTGVMEISLWLWEIKYFTEFRWHDKNQFEELNL